MRIAFIGCGFVADLYVRTLPIHRDLQLVGVFDLDAERAERFAGHHHTRRFRSLAELTEDDSVELVLNLTPPAAHADVTRACLEAGKHVYSEKPLAPNASDARGLLELAEQRGLGLACAPCSVLGDTAQTLWRALRQERIGRVRLVYAEMDDGLIHRAPYRRWRSASGAPWPWKNELETGCTLEHAGYQVTWLATFFGPVRRVTAFASVQVPDKRTDLPLEMTAPDFSLAALEFDSGLVARLTCSAVAPRDHGLRIFGDEGVLSVPDTWHQRSPVRERRWWQLRRRQVLLPGRRLRLADSGNSRVSRLGASEMDYLRGVSELAEATTDKRPCRLSARFCLHVNEVVLAIHRALETPGPQMIESGFDRIEPMPWALD